MHRQEEEKMIFGNAGKEKEYLCPEDVIAECLGYAREHDLKSYEKGRYEIDGKRLFFNIAEYETREAGKCFWEAHREYLDVHLMLQGTEQIDLNFVRNMEIREYVPEDDFLPMEGEKNSSVTLREGDFLICMPEDAHRTAVAAGKSEKVKKAIFKVRKS